MQFENKVQEQVYNKVLGWMKEIFGESAMPRTDAPGIGLVYGSAFTQVWVYPWGDDDATVRVIAWVVQGPEASPDLYQYLLKANSNMRFGAFAVDDEGDIAFIHTIVGSTCDKNELKASVLAVLHTADKYDDEIMAKWGGQRALDKMR